VPVGDGGEYLHHRRLIKLVDGDDLEVSRESRRDVVPSSAGGTHRADEQLRTKTVIDACKVCNV